MLPVDGRNATFGEDSWRDEHYPWPHLAHGSRWVRCNMVMSLDGIVVGRDGRSGSLSTDEDRIMFNALRRDCDVVVVGAGTVRTERYQQAPWPIAIVSASVDLAPDLPLLNNGGGPIFIVTSQQGADQAPAWIRQRCSLVATGESAVDLAQALARLASLGMSRMHCEGGTQLLSALVAQGLIDEFLVTIAPQLLGGNPADHMINLPHPLNPTATGAVQFLTSRNGTTFMRVVMRT